MQLTREAFDQNRSTDQLRIALIGMSNIGKSYTAQRLSQFLNMPLIEIDKVIANNLGQQSMEAFAAWQGQPYEAGYAEREARSVTLESEATREAIAGADKSLILDTTGSVIYTDPAVLTALKSTFWIVYIEASEDNIDRLKMDYYDNPKPLVWAGHFAPKAGLSDNENIMACYPDLLKARAERYAALADVTLASHYILDPNVTAADIFERLKPSL